MSVRVELFLPFDTTGQRGQETKIVDLPAVPRVGEEICFDGEGGRNFDVRRVVHLVGDKRKNVQVYL